MNNLVYQQIEALLADSAEQRTLTSENALGVGAATLCNGTGAEISATTVICEVPADEIDLFTSLTRRVAREYGLQARIRQSGGSYSVRFTRPPTPSSGGARPPDATLKSKLARLFAPKRAVN